MYGVEINENTGRNDDLEILVTRENVNNWVGVIHKMIYQTKS